MSQDADLSPPSHVAPVARAALLASGTFALSLAAVVLRPEGSNVAVWWPAAALAVALVALAPARERPWLVATVVVSSALANVLGGRPPVAAVAFGVSNAVEAWVAAWLLTRGGRRPRLRDLEDATRFLLAAIAGGVAAGLVATAGAGRLLDNGSFDTFRSVAFAHTSAVVLLVPLVLLRRSRPAADRHPVEVVAQWVLFASSSAYVFGPGQVLPLAFLPLPVLVWAAARLGPRAVALQTALLGVGSSLATIHGMGPFSAPAVGHDGVAVSLTQLFLVTYALVLVPLAMAIEQRRETTDRLRASEELYRHTFEEAVSGMLLVRCRPGVSVDVLRANPVATRLLLGPDAPADPGACRTSWPAAVAPRDRPVVLEALSRVALGEVASWHGEVEHVVDGRPRWVEVAVAALPAPVTEDAGAAGAQALLTAQLVDVTERRQADERLRELALHDALTGLPNRSLLADRVEQTLHLAQGGDTGGLALLFCDLDAFKDVNDATGHATGDRLLVEVARRFAAAVRPGDTVARLGGDEFVVLAPGVVDAEAADALARRLLGVLERPVVLDGRPYRVGVSIGIALATPASTVDSLLRESDLAMYASKSAGRGRATLYREEHSERAVRRVRLDRELRSAVERGELLLHVQPVVDLVGGGVVAGETLLRWQHPTRGLLPPGEFLDVLEDGPLIHEVGRWVLQESCRLAAGWVELLGEDAPCVHVNVSARQLDRGDVAAQVAQVLQDTGLAPQRLVVELTETYLSELGAALRRDLEAIAATGARLAADDFGTGYSPLTRLTDMPVDVLKIDRQFVDAMTASPRARAVVQAVVGMSAALGLDLVAEGVETAEQASVLRRLGCATGQGYLWSRPVPPQEFTAFVRARTSSLSRFA
ncbi:putative bifunctional diguanylate cyclase/phosphodiesterase [Thalassiella azotivora]